MAEKRYISTYIDSQLPDYVRADHPMFVSFLEAYYEWMESVDNATYGMAKLQDYSDIDESIDKFAEQFHNQYINNFPVQLARNPNTRQGLNKKNFIKNIKKFYSNKGTEKAYNFLFQTFFNTEAEIMLPKENILVASGGVWEKNWNLKTTSRNTDINIDKLVNHRITQFSPETGKIEAYGIVESVTHYPALHGAASVTEFSFKEVWHPELFKHGQTISGINVDGDLIEEQIYPIAVSLTAGSVGNDYLIGDNITFGMGGVARVNEITEVGGIVNISVQDWGINPNFETEVTVQRNGETAGTGEEFTLTTGSMLYNSGRYINNKGFIGESAIRIQDSYYYQPYSYVIKSELVLNQYKDLVKKLIHPAGMELFSSVQISKYINTHSIFSGRVSGRTVPFIGHYTPYTFGTVKNLGFKTIVYDNKSRYEDGYDPTNTGPRYCCGGTGGMVVVVGDGVYTGGEFSVNDELRTSSGKTATVFNFNVLSHLEIGAGNQILKYREGTYSTDSWFGEAAGNTAYSWLVYAGEEGNTGILRLSYADGDDERFAEGDIITNHTTDPGATAGVIDRVGRGNGTTRESVGGEPGLHLVDDPRDALGGVNHPETGVCAANAFPAWHGVTGSPPNGVGSGYLRQNWVIFNHPNKRAGGEVPGSPALGSISINIFNNEETAATEFNIGGLPKPIGQALNYPYVGVSGSYQEIEE